MTQIAEPAVGLPSQRACPLTTTHAQRELRALFDTEFAIWNGTDGELVSRPVGPIGDEATLASLVRVIADKGEAQIIAEAGPVCVLAIPFPVDADTTCVATAPIAITGWNGAPVPEAERMLDLSTEAFRMWYESQNGWPARALAKLGAATADKLRAEFNAQRLSNEIELVSENLASTYEEISLLYAVTQNLRISSTNEELGRLAIEWLGECVAAESFAVLYFSSTQDDESYKPSSKRLFITTGNCPVDEETFLRLVESLPCDATSPYVANETVTGTDEWKFPTVRQLIAVPLVEGENVFGWIAAFNHKENDSLGTVEANLIGSLGTLLGIHCGNRELYRQQSELLKNIVRALVSAIDAKDPYTSGHSDRVSRIAVRIAEEMQCSAKFINTIYMAGLLHDVGKIGIDDNVLRKAGRLTDFEFEHIKRHPELGYKILADLKKLSDVLPAVLHHHEQWNGKGYPMGLSGEGIPLMARIMSVADAYDAMTSDRPYRAGMPIEKVLGIFREDAGSYWDPAVVSAMMRAHDEIHAIAFHEPSEVDAFQQQMV